MIEPLQAQPTRETFWLISHVGELVFYYLAVVTIVVFLWGVYDRFARYGEGEADPYDRLNDLPARIGRAAKVVATNEKQFNRDFVGGVMHAFILWGFLTLLIGTSILAFDMDIWTKLLGQPSFFVGDFYLSYSLVMDAMGLLFVVGVGVALWRRYARRNERLWGKHTNWEDDFLVWTLFLLGVGGYVVEAVRILGTDFPPFETVSFVGWFLAVAFESTGVTPGMAQAAYPALWWSHALLAFVFIAAIPYAKPFHMISSFANVVTHDDDAGRRLPGVAASVEDQEGEKGHQAGHENGPVELADEAVEREHVEDDHDEHHHGILLPQGPFRDGQRDDHRGRSQDEGDVADVGADDVAERQPVVVGHGREEVDDELGHRGAQRHDGQTDDEGADAVLERDAGRSADEPLGTEVQDDQAGEEDECVEEHQAGYKLAAGGRWARSAGCREGGTDESAGEQLVGRMAGGGVVAAVHPKRGPGSQFQDELPARAAGRAGGIAYAGEVEGGHVRLPVADGGPERVALGAERPPLRPGRLIDRACNCDNRRQPYLGSSKTAPCPDAGPSPDWWRTHQGQAQARRRKTAFSWRSPSFDATARSASDAELADGVLLPGKRFVHLFERGHLTAQGFDLLREIGDQLRIILHRILSEGALLDIHLTLEDRDALFGEIAQG